MAVKQTALRQIRLKCIQCCMGSAKEVEECSCGDEPMPCPLYEWRFGKHPYHKGRGKPSNNPALQTKPLNSKAQK